MKKLFFLPLLLISTLCWSQYSFIAKYKATASINDNGVLNEWNYEKCSIQTWVKEIYAFTTVGYVEVGDEKYSLVDKIKDEDDVQQYKATGKLGAEFVIFFAKQMNGSGIEKCKIYILDAQTLKGTYYECWPN